MDKMDESMTIASCKRMLEGYSLPTDYLDIVISNHYEKKEWLINTLNLGEENNFRVKLSLPTNDLESRPVEWGFLQEIEELSKGTYKVLDLSFMWKGRNKVRIGKILPDVWDSLWKERETAPNFLSLALPLFSSFEESQKKACLHKFSCSYGDRVKNGRTAYLSLNPFDFLTMAEENHCTYTSCLKPNGEYFNTVLHYLNSNSVLLAFITENGEKKKIGRTIFYINPTMVLSSRLYGSFFDADCLFLRDYLHEILGGEWVRGDGGVTRDRIQNNSSAYIDYDYGIFSYKKYATLTPAIISTGICLSCGENACGEQGGVCSDCVEEEMASVECYDCHSLIDEGDVNWINETSYCSDCFNEVAFVCSKCGDSFLLEEKEGPSEDDICMGCFENYYGRCDSCMEAFPWEDLYEDELSKEGYSYCLYCKEELEEEKREEKRKEEE